MSTGGVKCKAAAMLDLTASLKQECPTIQGSVDLLGDRLSDFNSIFATAAAGGLRGSDATPNRHSAAIYCVQKEDGLTAREKLKLINLFTNDTKYADVYMGLVDDELRMAWIENHVAQAT